MGGSKLKGITLSQNGMEQIVMHYFMEWNLQCLCYHSMKQYTFYYKNNTYLSLDSLRDTYVHTYNSNIITSSANALASISHAHHDNVIPLAMQPGFHPLGKFPSQTLNLPPPPQVKFNLQNIPEISMQECPLVNLFCNKLTINFFHIIIMTMLLLPIIKMDTTIIIAPEIIVIMYM